MEPLYRDTLLCRIRDETVTILDVRPPEEFRAGHIEGAVSVPLEELDLPVPPAIIVGDVIATEGKDVEDTEIEYEICRQPGLPALGSGKRGSSTCCSAADLNGNYL
jgi:rhodanese-related sulfurtransferase